VRRERLVLAADDAGRVGSWSGVAPSLARLVATGGEAEEERERDGTHDGRSVHPLGPLTRRALAPPKSRFASGRSDPVDSTRAFEGEIEIEIW
jgi:hypothetical protein